MTATQSVDARRRQRQLLLLIGALSLTAVAAGVILAGVNHPRPVDWARLGPILGVVAAAPIVLLLVLYRRGRRSTSMFAPSPLLAFPAADRRRLVRAIKRADVVTGLDREPSIAAAEHILSNRALRLLTVAAACQLLGAVLIGPAHAVRFWMAVAACACLSLAGLEHMRLRRRARRFLAANSGAG